MIENTEKFLIEIQQVTKKSLPITDKFLIRCAKTALLELCNKAELTVRLINKSDMQNLNFVYRHQNKPTNVLAFPSSLPACVELPYPFLGDVILCPEVIFEESITQHTPLEAHWAHILIHGILHLLGFDHIQLSDEKIMQTKEIQILKQLGFTNPYLDSQP